MTSRDANCRVCGATVLPVVHTAREMMYGLRTPFDYLECSDCGCLQIAEAPTDLSDYYPSGYYSLSGALDDEFSDLGRRDLYKSSLQALLFSDEADARAVAYTDMRRPVWSLRRAAVDRASRILDIGCGAGRLPYLLKLAGFEHVAGLEAHIPGDITYLNGLTITRGTVEEAEGQWNLVMLHHVFEHLPDPAAALAKLAALLAPGGRLLLRLPLADSFAWRTYGVDWVQLDAPRHLFLHTMRSLRHLADRAGLAIFSVDYDSFDLQFWGSEQYRMDIPLRGEGSYAFGTGKPIFPHEQVQRWRQQSETLNLQQAGDQAAIILTRLDGDAELQQ